MEVQHVCFATLSTGSKIKLTEEEYNKFCELGNDDFLILTNGTTFKKAAVMSVENIDQWVDDQKDFDYHQPYTELPPGIGFNGIISNARHLKDIEAIARGLKKAKAKLEAQGRKTPNIDEFIKIARLRYLKIQHEV